MTRQDSMNHRRFWRAMRWVVWGGAAMLLSLPLIAMRFTTEVQWTALDFIVMGTLLTLVGIAFEIAVRAAHSHAFVIGAAIAAAAAFLITWSNLAVGIIGDERNPANLIFFGVLLLGGVAVVFSRLQPQRLARAMELTAVAQAIACVAALVLDGGKVFLITCAFLAMWVVSARLFRAAARA